MSDPSRTDAARPADRPPDADKEARIEELLLAGLDHYFAGQYEQAINVWTRVVFLERGHGRARAYIERARGALAERQRESEELLHRGIAAFNSGQTDAARDLITRAVEQDGPHDVAMVLLERLNRLVAPTATADAAPPAVERGSAARAVTVRPVSQPRRMRFASAFAIATVAVVIAVSGLAMADWLRYPSVPEQVAAMPPDPLPVATSSERVVARARALQTGRRFLEALRVLDGIDLADPVRPEADELRGELQHRLLSAPSAEIRR